MTDFLLELRSEEIPARMQDDARQNLKRLFEGELAKAGLKAADIATYATPRRLALIAYGLPLETEAVSEEIKGPKVGAPPQALEGFLRKTGLTEDQLVARDGVNFAIINKPGRATADVLAEAIPAIIRAFPWPKSMRWGEASASTESLRWVRPLQGIVALLGDAVVPCAVDGIVSGAATVGHRFMHQAPFVSSEVETVATDPVARLRSTQTVKIKNASTYSDDLRAAYVILDQEERRAIIRAGAEKAASDAGLILVQDPWLVDENAGLTEWPVPMLGRFDPAFLAVPPEVIQLTARVNQKYFVCHSSPARGGGSEADGGGRPSGAASADSPLHHPADGSPPRAGEERLAPAFICTANLEARDGGTAVISGNEKVLAARLSDAKFFWEQDLKVSLEDQAKKLSNIVFHEKLGTVADKVERVAKLARWLVESGVVKSSPERGGGGEADGGGAQPSATGDADGPLHHPSGGSPPRSGEDLAQLAETAARLCKADLVTGMVGEFPELQGVMGGYYARAQGHPDAVANAIRDHYKPVGQGDDVPTAPVTVAVSLADKLDTLVGFFAVDMPPTGSKDPFALRRAALSVIRLIVVNGLNAPLQFLALKVSGLIFDHISNDLTEQPWKDSENIADFLDNSVASVAVQNEIIEQGKSHDLIRKIGNKLYQERISKELLAFFADRLKVQQREAGVRHDLIDAVFALGGEDDLVRLLARVRALQAFVGTEDGVNLIAGYKRAANILKGAGNTPLPFRGGAGGGASPHTQRPIDSPHPNPSPEGEGLESLALQSALDTAEPLATAAIDAEDFEGAMAALASLRAPIDAFFEGVMVNDPDADIRAFRLGLLVRVRDAVHRVADFSKIEG